MRRRFISEGLENYLNKEHKVWHMPGHKRRAQFPKEGALSSVLNQVMAYDVTEVPGTDDLYLAEEFLKDSLEQLKDMYQTAGSYYIVNGSTGGIFTAIAACVKPGDKIIMARNCHKSVYNAVEILGLQPVYVKDGNVAAVCRENPDAAAVVITSPTYEGVISDIESICKVAKENDTYVIVDEAHGAHLPFMEKVYGECEDQGVKQEDGENCKLSAISQGADLVVQSTHKTLPAMTQTALLHVCNETLVKNVERYWRMFLSSSPSYILMASTEQAVCVAEEFDYREYLKNIRAFRKRCKEGLKHLTLVERKAVIDDGGYDYDETRIVIYGTTAEKLAANESEKSVGKYSISGPALLETLEETSDVVCEMAGENYVVLISTIADTKEDFDYLYEALKRVDDLIRDNHFIEKLNVVQYTEEYLNSLVGSKAKDAVYVYPPGSYILTKDEMITRQHVDTLIGYQQAGLRIRGEL